MPRTSLESLQPAPGDNASANDWRPQLHQGVKGQPKPMLAFGRSLPPSPGESLSISLYLSSFKPTTPSVLFSLRPEGPIAEGLGAVPMARVKLNARHVRPTISQGNECLHVLGHALGCITA